MNAPPQIAPELIEEMARASYDVAPDQGRIWEKRWDDLSADRQAVELGKVMAMLTVLRARALAALPPTTYDSGGRVRMLA